MFGRGERWRSPVAPQVLNSYHECGAPSEPRASARANARLVARRGIENDDWAGPVALSAPASLFPGPVALPASPTVLLPASPTVLLPASPPALLLASPTVLQPASPPLLLPAWPPLSLGLTLLTPVAYPDDPCLTPPAPCDPRICFAHPEGFLFVTAAPPAPGTTPTGYVAVWRDFADAKPYVFARRVFTHTDLGHAILRLEALLGVDRAAFTSGSATLLDSVNWALADAPDATYWAVATRGQIATVLGFGPTDITDPLVLLADDDDDGGLDVEDECGETDNNNGVPVNFEFTDTSLLSLDDLARELGQGIDCCDEEACCDDDGDCGPGEHCVEGECYADECDDENCPPEQPDCECPPGQHCEGGECVTGPCDDNGDCAPGQECVNGDCTCDDDGDCPSGDECVDGLCEDCPGECCDNADCDDGNPCTQDVCSRGKCRHFPKNCDDRNPCTDDHCNPITGACYYTPSSYCDDDNPCTEDECDPVTWECTHVCHEDCYACDMNGDELSDGYCMDCLCNAATCGLQLQANPSLACWGGRLELSLAISCDPPCGSVSWHLSADPPEAVASMIPSAGYLDCTFGGAGETITVDLVCDPPQFITFFVEGTGTNGRTCGAETTIETEECIEIVGERIDQDNPTSTQWIGWADGSPIYGGSEASTADNGRLTIDPGPGVVDIEWTAESEGGGADFSAPPEGPEATVWNLGDLLGPQPGLVKFRVTVTHEDGSKKCGDFDAEIGVRTDDVIVIGWIDPSGVPLNPLNVRFPILFDLPITGPPVPFSYVCNAGVGALSEGYEGWQYRLPLNNSERDYILNWLFKYGGNSDPLTFLGLYEFRDSTNSHIEYDKVAQFRDAKTNYKLFNHFQIRYLATGGAFTQMVKLREDTGIGDTVNPCGAMVGYLGIFPGQEGPNSGPPAVPYGNNRISLIVDGSPDAGVIRAFNTLMGKGVTYPVYWESIGNRIRFSVSQLTSGEVTVQPYPTYYVFKNGALETAHLQAPSPDDHFFLNPYPFGMVWCDGEWGWTLGGRCGDAEMYPHITARIPEFVLP